MFKLFSYVYNNDKIIKSFDFVNDGVFNGGKLFDYLSEICFQLDISVPVILKSHINHLKKFNHTKFTKTDFVEPITFSRLAIQKFEE